MIVSWVASYPNYKNAASNARVVGKELSLILNHISSLFFQSNKEAFKIHCIGHSLGMIDQLDK